MNNGPAIDQSVNPSLAAARGGVAMAPDPAPALEPARDLLNQKFPESAADLKIAGQTAQAVGPSELFDPVTTGRAPVNVPSAVDPAVERAMTSVAVLSGTEQRSDLSNIPLRDKIDSISKIVGKDHMADLNRLLNERCGDREQRLEVIDSLYELSESKNLNPELRDRKTQLIQSLVREAARPCQEKRQGEYASCVVASGVHRFALDNPEAYVRMVRDLVIDGEARFADGQMMKLDIAALNMTKGRNLSEAIVQQSAMRHFGIENNVGAWADQAELFFESTFDRAFTRKDAVNDALHKELAASQGVNMLSLNLGTGDMHNNHAFTHVGAVYNEKNELVGHLLRNPWGQNNENLPADFKVSDKGASVYFIGKEDFEKRFNYAVVPGGERGATPGARDVGTTIFGDVSPIASGEPVTELYKADQAQAQPSKLAEQIELVTYEPKVERGQEETIRVRRDNSASRKNEEDAPILKRPLEQDAELDPWKVKTVN